MAPSAGTVRILWARAGGRCAVCRCPLILAPPQGRVDSAGCNDPAEDSGARRRGCIVRLRRSGMDRYDNLILLCEDHESLASGSAGASGAERLAVIKARHEAWVRQSALAEHPTEPGVRYDPRYQGVSLLPRVRSGAGLVWLLDGVHSVQHDQDELRTPEEMQLLEGFIRYLRGVIDLWKDYDPAERRRVAGHLEDQISALERGGLLLCAIRYAARAAVSGAVGEWSILRMWILREAAGPDNGR